MIEYATGPGFFQVLQDRAIALVDAAVKARRDRRRQARGEQLEAAQAELEAIERGESTADRWQVEQRLRHAENQLTVAGARRPEPMRVAALADVHGNAPALEAVLAEPAAEAVDLIVFCGDLTWGPLPNETLAIVRGIKTPVRFVRGNADRSVGVHLDERGTWLAAQHGAEEASFVNGFDASVVADVDGLGATGSCTARRAATRSA